MTIVALAVGVVPAVTLMIPPRSFEPAPKVMVGPVPAPVPAVKVGVPPIEQPAVVQIVPVPVDCGHAPAVPKLPPNSMPFEKLAEAKSGMLPVKVTEILLRAKKAVLYSALFVP